jgi:hypothetical protein
MTTSNRPAVSIYRSQRTTGDFDVRETHVKMNVGHEHAEGGLSDPAAGWGELSHWVSTRLSDPLMLAGYSAAEVAEMMRETWNAPALMWHDLRSVESETAEA